MKSEVRPDPVGGVRLRVGGHVWDATLAAGALADVGAAPGGGRPWLTASHSWDHDVREPAGRASTGGSAAARSAGSSAWATGSRLSAAFPSSATASCWSAADGLAATGLRPAAERGRRAVPRPGRPGRRPATRCARGPRRRACRSATACWAGSSTPGPPARRRSARFGRRTYWPVEREAPGVVDRQPVREPLHTGTKVIDALLAPRPRPARTDPRRPRHRQDAPCALDAILAQRDTGVLCVYAAIGAAQGRRRRGR